MENHNKLETVVVDNKPSSVRIGRFPMFCDKGHSNKSTLRSNRYLSYQKSRIANALTCGKVEKAVLIWLMLIKLSKTYQILMFTKCKQQWYVKAPIGSIRKDVIHVMNQCRAFNLAMNLKRFYLLKPNGKYRPIGAPTIGSKVISKMLTDLWMTLSENNRSEMQHAFRPNRGTWSAAAAVIEKLKTRKADDVIVEFDLKGFFNTIKRHAIHEAALRYSMLLANCIKHIMDNTRYIYDKLRVETELIKVDLKHWRDKKGNKDSIYRSGVPQGLPLSPLAATIALENEVNMKELVLYADDGILIGGEDKFKEFVQKSIKVGAEVAVEKTRIVEDKFKFLGLTFDIKNESVSNEHSWIYWSDKNLINWLKRNSNLYSKVPETWDWRVDGGSYLKKHELFLGNIGLWKWIMVKIGYGHLIGIKLTGSGEMYYVSSSSNKCCEDLLNDAVGYKLKKVLPFRWKFSKPAESHRRNRYIELGNDWDGWYNANKMNWNLHTIWGNLKNG
jgi:hypothetical protein